MLEALPPNAGSSADFSVSLLWSKSVAWGEEEEEEEERLRCPLLLHFGTPCTVCHPRLPLCVVLFSLLSNQKIFWHVLKCLGPVVEKFRNDRKQDFPGSARPTRSRAFDIEHQFLQSRSLHSLLQSGLPLPVPFLCDVKLTVTFGPGESGEAGALHLSTGGADGAAK